MTVVGLAVLLTSVAGIALAADEPAGVRDRTEQAPEVIVHDCSVDVTAQLAAWLQKVPKRTTAVLARDGCYRIDGTVQLVDRRAFTLDGNGATLRTATLADKQRRHLSIIGGNDIVVRRLTVRGSKPPESVYTPERAFQHAFELSGVKNLRLQNVQAYDVWGDFVYIGSDGRNGKWSRGVRVVDSRFERSGRQGIAITAGRDVVIRDSHIADAGRSLFDLEANSPDGGAVDVRVIHNTTGAARNFWLANKGAGTQIRNVVFADNVMVEPTGGLVFVFGPLEGYRGPYTFARNKLSVTDRVHDEGSKGAFFLSRASDVKIRDNVVTFPAGTAVPVVESRDSRGIVLSGNDFRNAGQTLIETTRVTPTATATTVPAPTR